MQLLFQILGVESYPKVLGLYSLWLWKWTMVGTCNVLNYDLIMIFPGCLVKELSYGPQPCEETQNMSFSTKPGSGHLLPVMLLHIYPHFSLSFSGFLPIIILTVLNYSVHRSLKHLRTRISLRKRHIDQGDIFTWMSTVLDILTRAILV